MRFLLVAAVALCAVACHSSSGGPSDPDADRDSFAASVDCNDNDAAVWRVVNVFSDTDRDGIGAGQAATLCVGNTTPAGFSMTSTDCAANDAAVHTLMTYGARDVDGDSVLVASAGEVCGNGSALPAGYFANVGNAATDCDDQNTLVWRLAQFFEDVDRDGVGAGQAVNLCAGSATPAGLSTTSTDCAANDSSVHTLMAYAARDADGDTVSVASAGSLCGNGSALPAGYFASLGSAPDCNDQNASVWRMIATYLDVDGDGVGSGSLVPFCLGPAAPPGSSFLGFDPLDTLTDPSSALVSDFDLNLPSLIVEQDEAGFDFP